MRSFLPLPLKISFILFLVLFSTVSCSEKKQIVFDSSEPLALAPDVQWAVVVEPYAAFRKTTDWAGEINGHCRKGDILQIKGNAVFNNSENCIILMEAGFRFLFLIFIQTGTRRSLPQDC